MIAKAKAISHGINDIRYITGESHNKNIRKNLPDIGQYDAIGTRCNGCLEFHAIYSFPLPSGEEFSHQN